MAGVFALAFVSFCTLIGIAYAMTPVPEDPTVKGVNDEGSVFYYRDGKTVLGKIGTNRQKVSLSQVPEHVQNSVLAAENRTFRSDPGFNTKAIARAVWVNATGGSTQGGSTITQQLAKNQYSDINNRTMKRKFQELFISIKLEDKYDSKDKILELYLNTIYFGRNTYGIQAASQEYFGKNVEKLDQREAALLAGIIQNPNRDPATQQNRAWAEGRYKYVLDGLVEMKKLDQATATKYQGEFPELQKLNKNSVFAGQNGYLLRRSINALAALGITEQDLGTKGYHIVTTWDRGLQSHMAKTVQSFQKTNDLPKSVHVGTTSIDASTGEILAAYGGRNYLDQEWDDAYNSQVQAGSSFKPYVLAAGLKEGIGLKSVWDTDSPMAFEADGTPVPPSSSNPAVVNASHRGYGPQNLIYSTAQSLNTVYVPLGLKVGLEDVIDTSVRAGLSKSSPGLNDKNSSRLSLGTAAVSPLDQASAYATFANNGRHVTAHSIKYVYRSLDDMKKRKVYKKPSVKKTDAFGPQSKEISADVTYALQQVVSAGTGTKAQLGTVPVAGKTGTTNEAKAVWFVGYTPKISTSVAMWRQQDTKNGPKFLPLQGIGGYDEVHGGDLPAQIWRGYMTKATVGHTGTFPSPAWVGTPTRFAKRPEPKESETPVCRPGQFPRRNKPCKQAPVNPNTPCQFPGLPAGCNPAIPPNGQGNQQPNWWCLQNPQVGPPMCQTRQQPPGITPSPSGDDDGNNGGGNDNTQTNGLFSRPPD